MCERRQSDASESEGSEVGAVGAVGRLVDCSQADDRRMIALVRARPLLYARNNMPVASYYAQVKRLWEEVADEMGWSVAEVRRKWSHVRNSYSRHLRNEMHGARTGRGRAVSRWYLADELTFLREHMATDTRSSPYCRPSLYLDMSEQNRSMDSADVKPLIRNPWFTVEATSEAAPLVEPEVTLLEPKPEPGGTHTEDSSTGSQAFGPDENGSYFQFFRGIYADYQELSSKAQRVFKRQCLSFLYELLDAEEEGVAWRGGGGGAGQGSGERGRGGQGAQGAQGAQGVQGGGAINLTSCAPPSQADTIIP